jgi:hypothetical protein
MYGFLLMMMGLFLQSFAVVIALRYYRKHFHAGRIPGLGAPLLIINGVMLVLVAGNILQVALWALLYLYLGEFQDYATAFYHSAVNFATLGYGDIVMSEAHRLLGPLQAVNGVLMIGVSTAALLTTFQDGLQRRHDGQGPV